MTAFSLTVVLLRVLAIYVLVASVPLITLLFGVVSQVASGHRTLGEQFSALVWPAAYVILAVVLWARAADIGRRIAAVAAPLSTLDDDGLSYDEDGRPFDDDDERADDNGAAGGPHQRLNMHSLLLVAFTILGAWVLASAIPDALNYMLSLISSGSTARQPITTALFATESASVVGFIGRVAIGVFLMRRPQQLVAWLERPRRPRRPRITDGAAGA